MKLGCNTISVSNASAAEVNSDRAGLGVSRPGDGGEPIGNAGRAKERTVPGFGAPEFARRAWPSACIGCLPAGVQTMRRCKCLASWALSARRATVNEPLGSVTIQGPQRAQASRCHRDSDDFFLNRVLHQLSLVVDIEFSHQVELVRLDSLDAQVEVLRDFLD